MRLASLSAPRTLKHVVAYAIHTGAHRSGRDPALAERLHLERVAQLEQFAHRIQASTKRTRDGIVVRRSWGLWGLRKAMAEMTARVTDGEGFLARARGKVEAAKPIQLDLLPFD